MKVIFVDIDGVLVTRKSLTKWGEMQDRVRGYTMLDPEPVKLLNDIIEKTGAKIVISSSWRIGRTVEDLKRELSAGGLNCSTLIDKTPNLYLKGRGAEICQWISEHWPGPPQIAKFVIIDDEVSDMYPYTNADLNHVLVQTNMSGGLMKCHAERILKILEDQDGK